MDGLDIATQLEAGVRLAEWLDIDIDEDEDGEGLGTGEMLPPSLALTRQGEASPSLPPPPPRLVQPSFSSVGNMLEVTYT